MSVEIEQPPTHGEVTFDLEDGGLYLRGDQDRIDALLAELLSPDELETRREKSMSATDAAAVAATAGALLSTGEEYLRLTADGLAKVREFGGQLDGTGAMRGYVRSQGGQIAGQLTFETVTFSAEQALALQTAAVSLALRSAIADVKKAVEEVQASVDKLARRVRAQEVGRVIGLYEHLDAVVASTKARGRLLKADWDSISGAGLELRQSLAALRAYVQVAMGSFDKDVSVGKRAKTIASFSDKQDLGGTLKLIAIAVKALHLWEYLRIEHVRVNDPDHVESALEDARVSLRTNQDRDRELVAEGTRQLGALREIGPLETHHLFAIPELKRCADSALDALSEFATVSRIDLPELGRHVHRPDLSETRAEVMRKAIDAKDGAVTVSKAASRTTTKSAKKAANKMTKPLREHFD